MHHTLQRVQTKQQSSDSQKADAKHHHHQQQQVNQTSTSEEVAPAAALKHEVSDWAMDHASLTTEVRLVSHL